MITTPNVIDVEVTIIDLPAFAPVDFAVVMMQATHGAWRTIWPDPRQRWRWLYWMARCNPNASLREELRRMSSPSFIYEGKKVQIVGVTTSSSIVGHYCSIHGAHDLWTPLIRALPGGGK